jgi:hypothetical protein
VPAPSLESLRRELREKFPQAHAFRAESEAPEKPADPFAMEAFPAGALSEIVCAGPGLGLWVSGLLGNPEQASPHPEWILIDGSDAFDPASFSGNACSRLLWVRCRNAVETLKAADLLARDGNVPFILLDASGLARRDLQGCPPSAWWRLKHVVEGNGGRLVVMSAFPIVPCSARRLRLSADLTLEDFDLTSDGIRQRLRVSTERLQRVN